MIKIEAHNVIMLKIEAKRFEIEIQSISKACSRRIKEWFLGKEKAKNWTIMRFTQQVLNVALKEIETKIPLITSELNTMKYNRKVMGYQTRNRCTGAQIKYIL